MSLGNLCTVMVSFIISSMVLKDLTFEHNHSIREPDVLANMAENREVC